MPTTPTLPGRLRRPRTPAPRPPPRAARAAVDAALARTSAEVTALGRPVLAALLPALGQAEREAARELRRWLASVPDGAVRYTAQHHRAALAHLSRALDTVAGLDPALGAALAKMGRAAGMMAAGHLADEVARFSLLFEGSVRQLPLDVAGLLATGEALLIPRFRASAARYAGAVRADVQRELAVGLLRGESIFQLTDRLVRHGGPRGLVALRGVAGAPGAYAEHIAEGLFRRYRFWGERVARTETQAAYNAQIDVGLRQARSFLPDLQRRWDASLDLRTCPACAELHGAVAPLGGAFPGGVTDAPLHPCCRCRVGAWRAAWTAVLAETAAD